MNRIKKGIPPKLATRALSPSLHYLQNTKKLFVLKWRDYSKSDQQIKDFLEHNSIESQHIIRVGGGDIEEKFDSNSQVLVMIDSFEAPDRGFEYMLKNVVSHISKDQNIVLMIDDAKSTDKIDMIDPSKTEIWNNFISKFDQNNIWLWCGDK